MRRQGLRGNGGVEGGEVRGEALVKTVTGGERPHAKSVVEEGEGVAVVVVVEVVVIGRHVHVEVWEGAGKEEKENKKRGKKCK